MIRDKNGLTLHEVTKTKVGFLVALLQDGRLTYPYKVISYVKDNQNKPIFKDKDKNVVLPVYEGLKMYLYKSKFDFNNYQVI